MIIDKRLSNKMNAIGISEDERSKPPKSPDPTHEWVAFCTSKKCLEEYYTGLDWATIEKRVTVTGAPKDVKYRYIDCPDCDFALCWKKMPIGEVILERKHIKYIKRRI
jgi:hypothetical protein